MWLTVGVDVDLVELRCPQYKGSLNCPGRVSLNTVFARMEELIGYLLMNSTRQGNGSSSWTSRGKWDGPGITVERKKEKKN